MIKTDHSGSLSLVNLRESRGSSLLFYQAAGKISSVAGGMHFSQKLGVSPLCLSAEEGHTFDDSLYPVTIL
jgi:hypothetical protein